MHLSLLKLPRSAARWRFLEPYQLHQIIWKGFPELKDQINNLPPGKEGKRQRELLMQENRFLYRYHDWKDDSGKDYLSVLIQSVMKPTWMFLDNESEGTTSEMTTFAPQRLQAGTRLRFFVRANPVVERKGYSDKTSRRIIVGSKLDYVAEKIGVKVEKLDDREQRLTAWIERKGAEGGFAIEQDELTRPLLIISPNHDYMIRRSRDRNSHPMTFTGVDFEGILRITNAEAFVKTLQSGIGRGKAFGFGLVTVAKMA